MAQLFNPTLINSPSDDPGLFVPFLYSKRAILFDLGDIFSLPPRDLLKISHAFISHTHMDHFAGFDHLLRIFLGREKTLYLYGPEGFLNNLEGKLSGYSWNLVDNYSHSLIICATEVKNDLLVRRQYKCQKKFKPCMEDRIQNFQNPILHDEDLLSVSVAILDHNIPSLGFSICEKFKVNIRKDVLSSLDLTPGPWLNKLKYKLYNNHNPDELVEVPGKNSFTLKQLTDQLAIITKGQKIAYISDVAYTDSNVEKMIKLASEADHLFIESAFLEQDSFHAQKKYHLTAKQAGRIAALAGVKRFTLFHFSPRYYNQKELFYEEAMAEYMKYLAEKP